MTLSLPDFSHSKILVAGDLMLDRYWTGSTSRISPEAPVPVVKVSEDDDRLGGAANVALNLASLGCNTSVHGITGTDEASERLNMLATEAGLNCFFDTPDTATTITKLRIISRHQQLIRMDFEGCFAEIDKAALLSNYESDLESCSAVVLSDYGKGSLSECQRMIQLAKARNIPVLIDPKGSSFDLYRGATLVTPNLSEFELVAGKSTSDSELLEKGEAMRAEFGWSALLITLGERGMALIEQNQAPLVVPTQAKEVFDVTGAGDTVIATLAACIGSGTELALATRISNLAAGVVVGKLGTATVSPQELQNSLQGTQIEKKGILSQSDLLQIVELCRSRGESIAMTNGCFDLLHPGHINYLQAAAKEADYLIVAINSDDSVSSLKGPNRPVNPVQDRMKMLASIEGIDWVCEFSEETPQRLISEVLPNVLIKGGDYRPEEVAGHDEVIKAGGTVKVLEFVDGYSSTSLIEKIKSL